ncbi:MAG: hypothetical protein Q7K65_02960 [Candidatus Buchananbacteria bacterium]|nr:hypothetical protein [Candidatus Buchananbacteria bacterium]
MKIQIQLNINADLIMRRSGYGYLRDRNTGQGSYARRLGNGFYPRFHVYIEGASINLHLDQKQASYEGTSAHSGEYDGEVVEREGERIKNIMSGLLVSEKEPEAEENKSFWKKLLG